MKLTRKLNVFIATLFMVIAGNSHGMEEQSSAAKKIILLNTATNATSLKEAAQSINAFVHANKEFNIIINDPEFCLQLIKHLAKKFNCSDEEAARALKTRTAQQRLKLQKELFETVFGKKPEIALDLEALRKQGADLNFIYHQKGRGKTLLMMAVISGNANAVQCLLRNSHIAINQQDDEGNSALMIAFSMKTDLKDKKYTLVIKDLLDAGADFTIANNKGDSLVKMVLKRRDKEVSKLINNATLLNAAKKNNCLLIQQVLDSGADINTANMTGSTALMEAAFQGHLDAAKCLLNNVDININQQTNTGKTALIFAVANNNCSMIDLLLAHGADINQADFAGNTALLWAVGERHPKAVQCLLNKPHIMIEQQNNAGDTALLFAIAIRNEEIINQLIDAGADLESANKNGITPLQEAAQTGSAEIFLLIDLAIKSKSLKVEKSKKAAKAA